MKKVILTYGLISGSIVAGLMLATIPMWENGIVDFKNGEVIGYTTMVISLSLVFFGIKSCRDNHYNGVISFWKAFKVGIMISLIASVMYALAWEVSYGFFAKDFMAKMSAHRLETLKSEGRSDAEIQEATAKMETFVEWYKNPLIRFPMTLMEILPVGFIITLISSAILRKKEFLPQPG